MGPSRTYPLILSLMLGANVAQGQVCSINLGPDVTICQGQTATLTAPAGFPNYLWSTGSNANSISVGTAGTYWGQVSYPSGELFPNGNFSAGNTGFNTQFLYSSDLNPEGNYYIGTNAASYHSQFFGTGNGNFMIVNSGWPSALFNVYCQTVTVCPEQTYTLSYRVRTLSNATPARLQWWVNGAMSGPEVTLPGFGGWQTINYNWTSAPGQVNATLCLRVMSGDGVGNDFGLDDISMQGNIVLRDEVDVNVTPLPVVDLGPDATLCAGQNLVLDVGIPGGTYLWNNGATASTHVISTAGVHSVTVTANGCSNSDAITVSYNALPVVDLGPDITLCSGQSTVLNAAVPGGTYGWQDGSTAATFNVNGPGIYSVNVSANGCSASDAITVAYNPTPLVNLGPDQVNCAGSVVVLDASAPGATYFWQNASTGPTLNASANGSYGVLVTVNGCTGSDFVNLAFTPLPVVNLGPDQTVCPGTPVVLNATRPGATYLWQDGSTAATYSAVIPGMYSVTVTVNGCSSSDSFTLSNFNLQVVDLGPDVTICQGQNSTIGTVVPGATYGWSNGAVSSTINVSTAGIRWVDVSLNGCVVRDSILVSVTPLPVVNLGVDRWICPGVPTLLNATQVGATYLWNTGATTATISAIAGNYNVTVTVSGCSGTDAIIVNAWPAAQVALGNDTTLCPGAQLVLNATQAGASYLWQNGAITPTFTVNTAGTYDVVLTNSNGCIAMDAINVSYASPTAINLGPDLTLCQGSTTTLDATVPGATYLWSTGAVTPTLTTGAAGNVSVTVTQGNCTVSDDINISTSPQPTVALGADTTLCPGAQLILNATGPGLSYLWSTGAVTPTLTVSAAGVYSVTVTNAANCTATDAITVAYASPSAIDLGPNITLCQGQNIVLIAALPGASYLWNTGAGTPTLTASAAGQYWVRVTQGQCSVSDTVVVTVNPMPQAALGPDVTLCAGEDVLLDATWPGATYLWNTGAVTPTLTASATGNYSVDVDLNGCVASDAMQVTVLSATALNLGPDVTLCSGDQVVLNATTPGASYLWSTGAVSATLTATTSGTYWARVSTGLCSVSDTVVVTVNPMPQAALGPDVTLCAGEDVLLDATWPGATYLWNTGAVTPTLTASTTGNYSVDVDLNGCVASDAVQVIVLSASALNLGPDVTLCTGEQVVLNATTPGAAYLWSTGAVSATLTATTSGTYWARVSTGLCSVSDTVVVTVNPMPQAALGPDVTLCAGEDVLLDATWPGATYLWSTGAVTPTLTASTTGNYSVDVDLNGCVASDAVQVIVLSASALDLGPDVSFCVGDQVVLNAATPGASYLWSTGAVSATLTATTSGTYWARVSNGLCSVSDTVVVTVNPMPQAALGPDVILCVGENVLLDATWPGATYLWNTGAVTPTLTASATGNYSVDVDLNGCVASDEVAVTVLTADAVDLGPDISVCAGDAILLDATAAGSTYLWNTGAVSATIVPSASGPYWVEVSQNGCSASDTVNVQIAPTPVIDLGADRYFCNGETNTTLDASWPGADHLWSTAEISPTILISNSGTYSVGVDLNGCVATDEITVTFGSLAIDLGQDTTLCPGQTLTLDVTLGGGTVYWNELVTGPTFTITQPGEVRVFFDGLLGCDAADTIMVFYSDPGAMDLGPDASLCEGEMLLLDATLPGASYLWDDGSTAATRQVTANGSFSVETTVGQCILLDAISVVFNPLPVIDLGPDVELCPGTSADFDAGTSNASYLWQNGSNAAIHTTAVPGMVSVTVTVNGCSSSDDAMVSVLIGPTPWLGNDTTICDGGSLQLDATEAGASYAWDNGSASAVRMVDAQQIYWVDASLNGCTVRDSIRVDVFSPNSLDLGPDVLLCAGQVATLNAAVPGAQYLWSTGAITSSITVDSPNNYGVTITVAGCSASDDLEVTLLTLEQPDLGPDIAACEGDQVILTASSLGSFFWSTGAIGPSISVSTQGLYTVTVDSLGCSASDAVFVTMRTVIDAIEIGEDHAICTGVFEVLDATPVAGASYLWNTGATGSSISISAPGTYTVEATGNCIEARATIVITADDCGTYVYVPSAFTPNADGINDLFLPSLAGPVDEFELDIFDRWGERIHSTTNNLLGWDGSYNGVHSQDGVYIWAIRYKVLTPDGVRTERLTGHVTLLR